MPFLVIQGAFHLTGQNKNGTATGFQPDGDSIQFKPDNPALLDKLDQVKAPHTLTRIGSLNLRFEGIDAPELHYQGARQPAPFAEDARDFLTGAIGMNPVTYGPSGITVKPPANDGQRGYILARSLEVHGRPVSFVFLGNPPEPDGATVFLDIPRLKQSFNYQLVAEGHAYPLFDDTLFHDLRGALTTAANRARTANKGVWQRDVNKAFPIGSREDAEAAEILYPKVFRRLADFFRENDDLADLPAWMEQKSENDELWTLPEWNRTHFDNVLDIQGATIKLKKSPAEMVFVSKK
jgi:endonuclease YncB( thermonuclease family)